MELQVSYSKYQKLSLVYVNKQPNKIAILNNNREVTSNTELDIIDTYDNSNNPSNQIMLEIEKKNERDKKEGTDGSDS